jgi:cyclophilin family peptidyl-prolyl cis-trans isomerase/HEAT repeat protein
MRRSLGALGAVVLSLAASRCASHRPTAAPAPAAATPEAAAAPTPAPTPVPAGRFRSLAEAEPALLALEDRRAFEPAVLDAAAASPDPEVRARAALAEGRIGDERAAPSLRRLLEDPAPSVRESAAFAAGLLRDPELGESLVPALRDPDAAVAARAAWSLGFLEQASAGTALVEALGRAEPGRRAPLVFALWRYPTSAAAAAPPFLADPDPAVHAAALYALARRPQASSLALLTAGLADPDTDTAALCARALGVLGKPESAGALWKALDGRRAPVVINALLALAALLEKSPGAAAPPESTARLTDLAGDANPNLAVPALALLRWATADREAFRRLFATATSGQGRRRQVAIQAVMAALPQDSGKVVEAAVASPDPFVRGAAAAGLASLPDAEARPLRETLMADPEAVVRLKVLEGLDSPEAARANRPLVERGLSDSDLGVRSAAIDLRMLIGGDDAWGWLRDTVVASYGSTSPDIPITAIGAAEKEPGTPEARAVVEAAYAHPSVLVSRLARRSLVTVFHADPARFPWRTYDTGKTEADEAAVLAAARGASAARVETSRGAFTIRLAGGEAPMTVVNFVALAKKGYFDGAPIHRVVPNFVVQDGDPTGTGSGGPGYEIRDEINRLPYRAATVGMALSGPDTGGSQWFVTQSPQPHLDGGYTVFGQVVAGTDVVNRIEQDDRIVRVTVGGEGR